MWPDEANETFCVIDVLSKFSRAKQFALYLLLDLQHQEHKDIQKKV
jgi:hypothetical protein